MLDNEIWKDIKYYEGKYMISNYGRVKSCERYKDNHGKKQLVHEKYITQHDNGCGYLLVCLWNNNKMKNEYVHRLVALTFISNPEHLPQVNHKDEDKQNNCVDNLEWCTVEYNNNYGTHGKRCGETYHKHYAEGELTKCYEYLHGERNKTHGKSGGENSHAKKVICDEVTFDCIKDCANYLNVNYGNLRSILSGNHKMPQKYFERGLRYAT